MKTVFVVLTINLVISKCYQFPEVTTSKYYVPIVNIGDKTTSIVFMKENNTDDILINSVLLELYSEQGVIISKSLGFKSPKKRLVPNTDRAIIILTKNLSLDAIKSVPFNAILKSFRCPVSFVITDENGYDTCENGTFNKSFLESAHDFMNEIWHTYRLFHVIISFPCTCPDHYITYSGKKESKMALYDRTIKVIYAKNKKDLKAAIMENHKIRLLTAGYPLRANIFHRFPTSITTCDMIDVYKKMNLNYTNGFCGMDALVMHDFMEHYQYNLIDPNDDQCDLYGFVEPDTKLVTGSLGCITRGEMDISFNSRFVVHYTTKRYFYLHYITTDSLSFVLKRPGEIALWHYAYNSYNFKTWFILFFLIIVIGVLTWALAWITKDMTGHEPRILRVYILNALTSILFGIPIRKRERFRILRGASLLCSIILLAYYQGNVNYQFTTRTRHKEIRTLKQLYDSKYVLYTSPSIQSLLKMTMNQQDKIQVAFLKRMQIKNETLGIGYVVDHPDAVTIARGEDVQMEVLQNYTDKNGSPLMYVVEESFHIYYLAYIARAGFPFVQETLCFMMRLLEAGLPNKYYIWTRRTLRLAETYPKTGSEPRPTSKICMDNMRVAFYVLAIGCLVSSCSFIVEVYRGKFSNKKYVVSSS